MKVCLFGDIHGNYAAFKEALPAIVSEAADLNICLGDICGYYFDEDLVIDGLRELPSLVVLRGNHDDVFLRVANGDQNLKEIYCDRYGPAVELFLKKDRRDILTWLAACPLTYRDPENGIAAFHGSPRKPLEEYVYPDSSLECCSAEAGPWIFLGHTHYAMDRSQGATRVVNPGSLGQPRDGGPARYAVVDTEKATVQFRTVNFDREDFARSVRLIAPQHNYLSEVFDRIKLDGVVNGG